MLDQIMNDAFHGQNAQRDAGFVDHGQMAITALFHAPDGRGNRILGMYGDGIIPLTQDEIASMAGCTRPTVNRALRSAAEAGVVDLARRRIRVLDLEGLRRLTS